MPTGIWVDNRALDGIHQREQYLEERIAVLRKLANDLQAEKVRLQLEIEDMKADKCLLQMENDQLRKESAQTREELLTALSVQGGIPIHQEVR